jgi:Ca-activated chloride channel homolog
MTTEERESRLTAYALNDPGLSPAARREIETQLASDPAARRAVEETRRIGQFLTQGLAAEQAATKAESVVTIPAPEKPKSVKPAWWAKHAVAAVLVVGLVGAGYAAWSKWGAHEQPSVGRDVAQAERTSAGYGDRSGAYTRLESAPGKPVDGRGDDLSNFGARTGTGESSKSTPSAEGGQYGANPLPADPSASPKPDAPGGGPGRSIAPGAPAPAIAPPTNTRPAGPGMPGPGGPRDGKPADYPPIFDKGFRPGFGIAPQVREPGKVDDLDGRVPASNDRHLSLQENSFTRTEGLNALSTFGVDVDTASYAIVRKYLSMGRLPPANAVRLEEMVNYFPYQDKPPEGDDPFAVTVEMAECPWEPAHRLVRLGLKAKPIDVDKRPASNLVFLIDVSGSMNAPNRLPLVKASLKLLVNQLGEKDRVAMVVYAGNSGLVLDSTPATKKETILNALDSLEAGGSTHGSSGIQQAYDVAAANFIKGGTNRVILCTDGDWNVGTTSTDALVKLIENKRESGVFLSVFGFGMGNLRDEMMVQLAGKGNGNYGYIDTIKEAHKALVEQLGGTLVTVAKDVKIQVEFNPAVIKSYRLLGYEKRALAAKDFHDDKKDAGEMGAGHVVTALYELVPVGAPDPVVGKVDGLKYQKEQPDAVKPAVKSDMVHEALTVKMRHKKPDADKSTQRDLPVSNVVKEYEKASEDFQFAAAVASFAMLLRDSPYKGNSNYALILELAESAKKHDPGGYRAEFIEMVRKAKALAGK